MKIKKNAFSTITMGAWDGATVPLKMRDEQRGTSRGT
jgi:hypothetical protein